MKSNLKHDFYSVWQVGQPAVRLSSSTLLLTSLHRQGSWRLAFLCHGCCLCRQLKGPEPQFFSCMLQPEWFGWLIIMVDGRTMPQFLLASWHKWHWFWASVSWGVYLSSTLSPSPPLPGYSPHSSLPTPQALLKCTECRLYKSPVRPEVCSPAMPARFTFLSCYDCISCSYHLKMIVVQRCYYILMATQLAFLGKPQCWSEMAPICTKCGFGHYAHPGFDLEVVWSVFSADGKVWHFSVSLSLVGLVGRALFTIAGSSCGEDGFKRSANIIVELE